jgi:hypothetical protein
MGYLRFLLSRGHYQLTAVANLELGSLAAGQGLRGKTPWFVTRRGTTICASGVPSGLPALRTLLCELLVG